MLLAVVDDLNVNGGSYGSRPDQLADSLRVEHFLSVKAYDHVIRLYPSVGSRTIDYYLLDQETRGLSRAHHLYTKPSAWWLMRLPLLLKLCCFGISVGRSQ